MTDSDELCSLTIAEAGRRLAAKEISPVELTQAVLDRIAALDPEINSYLLVTTETALAEAGAAEDAIRSGRWLGPLHGIPYGLKDIVETAGIRTTGHSKVLADYVPAEDAEVVRRLKAAGGILLGKLACHEFAGSGPDFGLPWPPARNPWRPDLSPGGSSSGSGAAVAAGLAMAAIGTDTAGSIRVPAGVCGIVGLKPTYGRVSRRGVIPHSFSLDHVGPMARTAGDCALMLQAIAGYDPGDPGSADEPVPDYAAALTGTLKGLRIGLVRHFHEIEQPAGAAAIEAMATALDVLRDRGATVRDVHLSPLEAYGDCRSIISRAEDYAVHEAEFRTRFGDFGPMLQKRSASGGLIRAVDYIQAQRRRHSLARGIRDVLREVDVLVTANPAWPMPMVPGARRGMFAGRLAIFAVANVTGSPAISIPIGLSGEGLPLAMQIIGRAFDEATVLRVADAYEGAASWDREKIIS